MNWERERCDDDQPDAEESENSWGDIWSKMVDHNINAKWLKYLQSEVNVTKQEKADMTKKSLQILGRMQN